MNIYAIGDLHLSGEPPTKPMSIFGANWQNHWQKIKTNWQKVVTTEDIVIVCGDISWAMKFSDALVDLLAIDQLPGKKVFIRGNHDFWWSSISKMQQNLSSNCFFLFNNFHAFADIAICGSRGWLTPTSEDFTIEDEKIYQKELQRVKSSLAQAKIYNYQKIILVLHYPPLYIDKKATGFTELCDKYQVQECIYGHLHAQSIDFGYQGVFNKTNYHLTSADALNFTLQKII